VFITTPEGFHEAIGDTISMSVSTPKHLKVVGLLDHFEDNKENTINFLMSQALKVLVDIPWALTLEQWRWDIFSGKVTPEDQNCHWWKLRSEIQGVRPPVSRSSTDFDPGAKFHVPSSVPYDR
jgi:peptidyl-dipeptidase A